MAENKDVPQEENKENENKVKENENQKQMLFISQGVIGKYLSELAYETANSLNGDDGTQNNQNYNFIYKLHPGEYGTWKENYDYLTKAVEKHIFGSSRR